MLINANERILFTGDSITDCGRSREDSTNLGSGYVAMVATRLQKNLPGAELKIINRGISGNQVSDLLGRFDSDLLDLKPTVISILIGINEVWRRYDSKKPTTVKTYEKNYRTLLEKIREKLDARIVLLEPFLLHVPADRHVWREDLNPKIDAVRRLAVKFQTELLPLDGLFAQAATQAPAEYWAPDGVHPSEEGHALIAQTWLENAGLL
jgi:lysophospholipase L1-like esterase